MRVRVVALINARRYRRKFRERRRNNIRAAYQGDRRRKRDTQNNTAAREEYEQRSWRTMTKGVTSKQTTWVDICSISIVNLLLGSGYN